jgi:hypothetical protein
MGDREEAVRLLAAASKDLKALTGMTDAQTSAEEIFGFHVQQAIEKPSKHGWLWLERNTPRPMISACC